MSEFFRVLFTGQGMLAMLALAVMSYTVQAAMRAMLGAGKATYPISAHEELLAHHTDDIRDHNLRLHELEEHIRGLENRVQSQQERIQQLVTTRDMAVEIALAGLGIEGLTPLDIHPEKTPEKAPKRERRDKMLAAPTQWDIVAKDEDASPKATV